MKWRNFTAKVLHKGIARKLSLEPTQTKRRSPHPVYWYVVDGKKTLRVTLPNIHGGSGSMSIGFLQQIRRDLRLTTAQFEALVNCPLTPAEFESIIREQ